MAYAKNKASVFINEGFIYVNETFVLINESSDYIKKSVQSRNLTRSQKNSDTVKYIILLHFPV